jgi:hypothetical protein
MRDIKLLFDFVSWLADGAIGGTFVFFLMNEPTVFLFNLPTSDIVVVVGSTLRRFIFDSSLEFSF